MDSSFVKVFHFFFLPFANFGPGIQNGLSPYFCYLNEKTVKGTVD